MIVEFRCDIERPRFWMSHPALSDEFSTQIAWTETGTPPLAGLERLSERIPLRKGGVTCFADTLKDAGKPRQPIASPTWSSTLPAPADLLCRAPLQLRRSTTERPAKMPVWRLSYRRPAGHRNSQRT
jgi:hypothetical protein